MKNFLELVTSWEWQDVISTALTVVITISAVTFGGWFIEKTIIVETPPGLIGHVICPTWLGLGALATTIVAVIIKENFFSSDY